VIDRKDGKLVEKHKISEQKQFYIHYKFRSSPAVVGGWVYVGSTDGCLYAFQGKE